MRINEGLVVTDGVLALVPYTRNLVPTYHQWMQDEDLLEQTSSERLTLQAEFEMCESWMASNDKLTFLLIDCTDGCLVGDINLFFQFSADTAKGVDLFATAAMYRMIDLAFVKPNETFDPTAWPPMGCSVEGATTPYREAEISVMIARESHRRKGLAGRAVRLMTLFSTAALGTTRYTAKISDFNGPSIQMFHKLGFSLTRHVACFNEVHLTAVVDRIPHADDTPTDAYTRANFADTLSVVEGTVRSAPYVRPADVPAGTEVSAAEAAANAALAGAPMPTTPRASQTQGDVPTVACEYSFPPRTASATAASSSSSSSSSSSDTPRPADPIVATIPITDEDDIVPLPWIATPADGVPAPALQLRRVADGGGFVYQTCSGTAVAAVGRMFDTTPSFIATLPQLAGATAAPVLRIAALSVCAIDASSGVLSTPSQMRLDPSSPEWGASQGDERAGRRIDSQAISTLAQRLALHHTPPHQPGTSTSPPSRLLQRRSSSTPPRGAILGSDDSAAGGALYGAMSMAAVGAVLSSGGIGGHCGAPAAESVAVYARRAFAPPPMLETSLSLRQTRGGYDTHMSPSSHHPLSVSPPTLALPARHLPVPPAHLSACGPPGRAPSPPSLALAPLAFSPIRISRDDLPAVADVPTPPPLACGLMRRRGFSIGALRQRDLDAVPIALPPALVDISVGSSGAMEAGGLSAPSSALSGGVFVSPAAAVAAARMLEPCSLRAAPDAARCVAQFMEKILAPHRQLHVKMPVTVLHATFPSLSARRVAAAFEAAIAAIPSPGAHGRTMYSALRAASDAIAAQHVASHASDAPPGVGDGGRTVDLRFLLGNYADRFVKGRLAHVTHVVCCAAGTWPPSPVPCVALTAEDEEGYDITQHFGVVFRFIADALTALADAADGIASGSDTPASTDGTILFHCIAGRNRSGAVLAASLTIVFAALVGAPMVAFPSESALPSQQPVTLPSAAVVTKDLLSAALAASDDTTSCHGAPGRTAPPTAALGDGADERSHVDLLVHGASDSLLAFASHAAPACTATLSSSTTFTHSLVAAIAVLARTRGFCLTNSAFRESLARWALAGDGA